MSTTDTADEHTVAAEEVDDNIIIDRSCISCDNCGEDSPQKCCGRCGSYYYCRYVWSCICLYNIFMLVCGVHIFRLLSLYGVRVTHHNWSSANLLSLLFAINILCYIVKSAKCNIGNNTNQTVSLKRNDTNCGKLIRLELICRRIVMYMRQRKVLCHLFRRNDH